MKSQLTKVIMIILLTGWMGIAQASLIFDFEFSDGTDTISGEILGLVDNLSGQTASTVLLTSNTTSIGVGIDFADMAYSNIFDVNAGQITSYNFTSSVFDSIYSYHLTLHDDSTDIFSRFYYIDISGTAAQVTLQRDVNPFSLRVTEVTEPNALMLIILGLAGIRIARHWTPRASFY
ncbi:hypothetical protein ACOYR1_18640 [Thalassotalea piscium]